MKTIKYDFLGPLPSLARAIDLSISHAARSTIDESPPQPPEMLRKRLIQFDPADCFTYIIMGLALAIAIVVPILNWN